MSGPGLNHILLSSAPVKDAERPDDEDFEEAWFAWASKVVARWNAAFPTRTPFRLEEFDGCTFAADVCRHCCLFHDLRLYFRTSKRDADRLLFDCMIAIGRREDRNGWWWTVNAWIYWLAVRTWHRWSLD